MTAAKKETLRWGVGRRADTEAAREKILDAALYCYQKYTLSETCMKQIAQEAKVSRQTLYRHFKNRDDIVLSLIIRELEGILLNIKDQLPTDSSFAEFVVESIAIADEKIRLSPIFELMINESAMLMERVHCYAKQMLTVSGMYFHERFNAAKNNGELRSGIEYDEFVTWLYRVGTSFIVLPQNEQRIDCIRPVLWRYLIPAFTRIDASSTLADTAA